MQLKAELDSIYYEVYKLSESTGEDQKYLMAGFEDAINEGIAKWLGKMAGKVYSAPSKIGKAIKSGYDKVKTGAKNIYDKGVELGRTAVTKIKDWFSKATESIKNTLGEWKNKLSQGWETFTNWCKETFDKVAGKLTELWKAMKDKNFGMDALAKFWNSMKEKISEAYNRTKAKFVEFGANIAEWVTKNWEDLKAWSTEKYDGALEWLRNKYDAALEYLKTKGGQVKDKVQDAAKWIATWICIKPYTWILNKVKSIPELFASFKEWLQKQALEFKTGFEDKAGRPWDRAKGFINPPELLPDGIKAPNVEEEEITKTYDETKNPFSLGKNNEWSRLGLSKRTKSGRNLVQAVIEKYHELEGEGLRKNEVELKMGSWMAQTFKKAGVVTGNSEQDLVIKQGNEKRAEELEKKINGTTDKGKLTLLKRELSSLKVYGDAKVDEDEIGKTTVDVVKAVMDDPRIFLYVDDASDENIKNAIDYMSQNGLLDNLTAARVESEARNNGLTEKAQKALVDFVKAQPKKRKTMNLPEFEYDEYESMRYIITFESFKTK